MMNGSNGANKRMALIVLAIALANFLILNFLRPRGVMAYILPIASWTFLAAVVLKVIGFSKIKSWFDKRVSIVAAMVAICYIVIIMDIGLLVGFGNSPYSFTPLMITINAIMIGSTLLGMEFSRAAIVKGFGKGRPFMAIGLVSLLYTIMGISVFRLMSFSGPLEFTKFLGVGLLPLIAENILATYLALIGGPVASLSYRAPMMAFWWFSPILPNLSWSIEALVGVMTPAVAFFVINQFVPSITLRKAGIPVERHGFSRPKRSSTKTWMFISIACVAMVWMSTGLLGVRASTVISGSMSPAMEVGDMAIVYQVSPSSIAEGDTVQYALSGEMVIHRVVEVYDEGGTTLFITKGDANSTPDMSPVQPSQVVGKVAFTIPKIGWAAIALKSAVAGTLSFISANTGLVLLTITSGIGIFCFVKLHRSRPVRRWGSKFNGRKIANQKIIASLGAVLIVTAMSGLVYASWTESLYISTTVNTGSWEDQVVIGSYKVLTTQGYDDMHAEPDSYLSGDSHTLVIVCDNVFNGWYTWVGLKTTNEGTVPAIVNAPVLEFSPDVSGSFTVQTYFYGPYRYGYEIPHDLWGGADIDELPFAPWNGGPTTADANEHVIIWMLLQSNADIGPLTISVEVDSEIAV